MKMSPFDLETFRNRLESEGEALVLLFEAADAEEAMWKPARDRWTLIEIANHLADEEVVDFRRRLRDLVEDPAREWPPFDTFKGVTSGEYAKRDFQDSVERFTRERSQSLSWLESLRSVDPDARYAGPKAGDSNGPPRLSVGDMMLSWLAHDYFHIRQTTRLRWEYLNVIGPPHRPDYAGREE